jgi:putative chitinase
VSAAAFFDAARSLKRELTGTADGLTEEEVDGLNAIILKWGSDAVHLNPTALSDSEPFFATVRKGFSTTLTQPQVEGFQTLLQAFGVARWPLSWTAYGLSTAWHETAATMQPVREAYWLPEDWRKKNLRYYPWYGRGFSQLTWQANYEKADEALGLDGALIANPDLALKGDIAARIITWGMEFGAFTGKRLSDYLPLSGKAGYDAYKSARKIINNTDKADVIAKEAQTFEAALTAGDWR